MNATLNEIVSLIHTWLNSNGFKIEKEIVKSTKSQTVAKGPANHSIAIWISGHAHSCSVLVRGTDEALLLINFLQSGGMQLYPHQQQQQQQVITVNIPPPVQYFPTTSNSPPEPRPPSIPSSDTLFCCACGSPNRKDALFCKVCGATIE